jgi:hypothetical protein
MSQPGIEPGPLRWEVLFEQLVNNYSVHLYMIPRQYHKSTDTNKNIKQIFEVERLEKDIQAEEEEEEEEEEELEGRNGLERGEIPREELIEEEEEEMLTEEEEEEEEKELRRSKGVKKKKKKKFKGKKRDDLPVSNK